MPVSPRAHALIDLEALRANVRTLRQQVSPAQVMVVVKADAYGHGAPQIAGAAREAGADWLGVAFTDEALALREAGDQGRLLAWLLVPGDNIAECIAADIDLSVNAAWTVHEIAQAAHAQERIARVHIAVDSGLGREGAQGAALEDLLQATLGAERAGDIQVVGMWTHLASAEEPEDASVDEQHSLFLEAITRARAIGLNPTTVHIANSAAALTRPDLHHDLVRLGIIAYGVTPDSALGDETDLHVTPVMSMRARIALTKQVPAGQGVSYGLSWRSPAPTTLALIPVGYADGVPRHGSNVGLEVLIKGRRYPIVGRVCMDQVVVDVGPETDVIAGDEAILFGDPATGAMTAHEWGVAAGTIGYDIVTRVGVRLPKQFHGGGGGSHG
jgi:alanine racemase